MAVPTLEDVTAYLGDTSYSQDEIASALAAETAAQAAMCRIPVAYPADLGEALKRRVARNLALRGVPLSVVGGDTLDGGNVYVPGRDPEIRRLEAPHRRLVVG